VKHTPSKSSLFLLVFCILIAETTGLAMLKEHALTGNMLHLAAGLGLYFVINILVAISMKYEDMGIINILWSSFSVILVVVTGMVFFEETLDVKHVIGIAFVIAGVITVKHREFKAKKHARLHRAPVLRKSAKR